VLLSFLKLLYVRRQALFLVLINNPPSYIDNGQLIGRDSNMNKLSKSGLVGLLILTVMLLPGCRAVEKTLEALVNGKKVTTPETVYRGDKRSEVEPGKIEKGKVEAQSGLGQAGDKSPTLVDNPGISQEKIQIVLYFASPKDSHLVKETRFIPKETGLARATLRELLAGPGAGSKLKNPIPKGTRLLDLNIKPDGLAIVDFSRELKTNHPGGSGGEALTIYAIVNTLTQFESINQVQILVEGERLESLAGHVDIAKPLERESNIIDTD